MSFLICAHKKCRKYHHYEQDDISYVGYREMLEEIARFILGHVTTLKHIGIVPWCNNKNEVPVIHGFRIYMSDF